MLFQAGGLGSARAQKKTDWSASGRPQSGSTGQLSAGTGLRVGVLSDLSQTRRGHHMATVRKEFGLQLQGRNFDRIWYYILCVEDPMLQKQVMSKTQF